MTSDENAAIKDVLRRDALSNGPWALRILDEIERLEEEVERLRGIEDDLEYSWREHVTNRYGRAAATTATGDPNNDNFWRRCEEMPDM